MTEYCICCGKRWNEVEEEDGKEHPMIWDKNIEDVEENQFCKRCYVHYYDGKIKEYKFKKI